MSFSFDSGAVDYKNEFECSFVSFFRSSNRLSPSDTSFWRAEYPESKDMKVWLTGLLVSGLLLLILFSELIWRFVTLSA